MTLGDKNQFDALMRLNEFRFERWQDRRKYEWRVSLGLWALMAAATYYKKTLIPPLPNSIVVVILVIIVLVHTYWVRSNLDRNQKDINSAFYYWDRARMLLPGEEAPTPDEDQGPRSKYGGLKAEQSSWCSFLYEPPCLTQVLTTFVLALILAYYLLVPAGVSSGSHGAT